MGEPSINNMRITAIVPAAGRGVRLDSSVPKQFIEINGKPILIHTLSKLDSVDMISNIIIAAHTSEITLINKLTKDFGIKKVTDVVAGGAERTQSVRNAFNRIGSADYVLVHDAARPFITEQGIVDMVHAGILYGAAINAIPVTDTVKLVDKDNMITMNVDRKGLWLAQTPQVFKYSTMLDAYNNYDGKPIDVTDEAGIMELAGIQVRVVEGSIFNIKITTEADLNLARLIAGIQ
jgi:2-C-methyl-D-erythritol 4-phosphate cytidylyltransferase